MGVVVDGLVFFTVGVTNSHSAQVVEAMRQLMWRKKLSGCAAIVLDAPERFEFAVADVPDRTMVVPLFDVGLGSGVNQWTPMPVSRSLVPSWARRLSTGSAVAVSRCCVKYPLRAEGAARSIAAMFLREFRRNGGSYPWGEFPWGPTPSPEKRRSRRGQDVRPRLWFGSHLAR